MVQKNNQSTPLKGIFNKTQQNVLASQTLEQNNHKFTQKTSNKYRPSLLNTQRSSTVLNKEKGNKASGCSPEYRLNNHRKLALEFSKCTNNKTINVPDNIFLICKENRIENATSFYSCYYLGPFAPGQGLTFGNTLRRTLLSTLTGIAITAVEIEGVTHEYASLPGLKETILDLLLAINEIVLTGSESILKKPLLGYLKKRGPGKVYARDLRLPNGIYCVDPNHYICTLSDTGCLNMKLQLQSGKGWAETKNKNWYNQDETQTSIFIDSIINPTQQVKTEEKEPQPWPILELDHQQSYRSINNLLAETSPLSSTLEDYSNDILSPQHNQTLATRGKTSSIDRLPLLLNPIFSPVKKINYLVESYKDYPMVVPDSATRLTNTTGEINSTDVEKTLYEPQTNVLPLIVSEIASEIIVLEIWTNGSLLPREALTAALRSCITTFSKFGQIEF